MPTELLPADSLTYLCRGTVVHRGNVLITGWAAGGMAAGTSEQATMARDRWELENNVQDPKELEKVQHYTTVLKWNLYKLKKLFESMHKCL